MIVPKKCSNPECNLYHHNQIKSIKAKQSRQHQELIKLIDNQTKIITNLTQQVQYTANQVITLVEQSRQNLTTNQEVD